MPDPAPRHALTPVRRTHTRLSTAIGLVALAVATAIGLWVVFGPERPSAAPAVTATPTAVATPATPATPAATPVPDDPTPSSSENPGPAGIPTDFPTPVSLPTPTDLPTTTPRASATASTPTGDLEPPLIDNRLYTRTLRPTACDQPPRPVPQTQAAYRTFLERTFGCLQDLYAPAMKAAGFTLTKPFLVFYTDRIATPCGPSPTDLSVFYCSANETVYATQSGLDDYTRMRLGLYYVVFHEYAHHVQERAGILDAARLRHEEWPQVSRRIELQAECMMGVALHTVRSTTFAATDRAQLVAWRSRVPDDAHGSSAAQIAWIERGLATRSLGRCNTWSAPLEQVQ